MEREAAFLAITMFLTAWQQYQTELYVWKIVPPFKMIAGYCQYIVFYT